MKRNSERAYEAFLTEYSGSDSRQCRSTFAVRGKYCAMLTAVCALMILLCAGGRLFAQSGGSLPSTTIAPADSGTSEGSPGGSSAPRAPEEPAAGVTPPPAHPVAHHRTASHHASAASSSEASAVEPANAKVKLKEDSWAYASPAKSSKRIEQVHAGKFVNVTGTTHYYARVQLKSGATAYVPLSAVELTRSVDKTFTLTSDASVLSEPSHYGKKVSEVHRGHSVHVVGIALNYVRIRMRNGLEGYIPLSSLQ